MQSKSVIYYEHELECQDKFIHVRLRLIGHKNSVTTTRQIIVKRKLLWVSYHNTISASLNRFTRRNGFRPDVVWSPKINGGAFTVIVVHRSMFIHQLDLLFCTRLHRSSPCNRDSWPTSSSIDTPHQKLHLSFILCPLRHGLKCVKSLHCVVICTT